MHHLNRGRALRLVQPVFLCTGRTLASSCAALACRFMLRLQKLTFRDAALENSFRGHWDASSHTLITLLSTVMMGIWAVGTWNVHNHCIWSRFLCRFLEALCISVILSHSYIQYQLRMYPGVLLARPVLNVSHEKNDASVDSHS